MPDHETINIEIAYEPDVEAHVGDIVFVHGIGSSSHNTWVTPRNGTLWPIWLQSGLPSARVVMVDYPAPRTNWSKDSSKNEMSLPDLGIYTLSYMCDCGFLDRPTVFVAHSMGGLLVKQMLRTATDCTDESWKQILRNTRGIVFVSTPNDGSSFASLATALELFRATKLTAELTGVAPLHRTV